MDGQSKQTAQALTAAFRDTAVWKQLRMSAFFQGAWLACDCVLLVMMTLSAFAGGYGWSVPASWAGGIVVGQVTKRWRKPLQGNSHLLAGTLGVVAAILFNLGHKLLMLLISALLLGISAAWAIVAGQPERLALICSVFDEDEDQSQSCSRELVRISVMPYLLVMCCAVMMIFRQMNLTVTLLALCSALCLIFTAFNDPVDRRVLAKLALLKRWQREGENTRQLRKWIDQVLVQKHRRPWLFIFLYRFFRIFFHHKVYSAQGLELSEDDPVVYVCNHGQMYGPLAAYVFAPSYVRPWIISNIMMDMDETIDYLYRYTFSHVSWIPRRYRHRVTVWVSRFSHWGSRQLEAVPVYRDHTEHLMYTFRASMNAMACGDPLLIFPQNPNAEGEDHGYERSGVGEFFSGFALLGQLWYKRSGKTLRFVPMYADQQHRTMRLGTPVVYDPTAEAVAQRTRISQELSAEMKQLASQSQAH